MQRKILLGMGGLIMTAASVSASAAPLPTVPQGVALVEVVRELTLSQPDYLWTRPGDSLGHTLMISDKDAPGTSKCEGDCAKEFPPLLAQAGAKAFGDWSLVHRPGGGQQWAYQTHPLYTWSKEENAGEAANNVGLTETANSKLAEAQVKPTSLMPPAGWQVARFTPAATVPLPDGIDVNLVAAAQGIVLVDYSGYTLYAFDGDAKRDNQSCTDRGCEVQWLPVPAAGLAMPVGDFSIVSRADGSKQWAYKRHPLYRYSGDLLPGDVLGATADKKWKVAALTESYRPEHVAIANVEGYGNVWTVNGLTLYGGHAFHKRWGGRNLRDGFRDSYVKGKKLNDQACPSGDCLKDWKPYLAPAGAQPDGFWEIFTRADGSHQWAYKGYALYTRTTDKEPGQITGQAVYDFAKVEGTPEELKRNAFLTEISGDNIYGGSGIYWSIARP